MFAGFRRLAFNVACTRVVPVSSRATVFVRPAFVYRSYSATAAGLSKNEIQTRLFRLLVETTGVNSSKASSQMGDLARMS